MQQGLPSFNGQIAVLGSGPAIGSVGARQLVDQFVADVAGMALSPIESRRGLPFLAISASMALISSTFFTGFFCEFLQPFLFQPFTHLVEQLMAYCESIR